MLKNSFLIVLLGLITVYFHPLKASETYSDIGDQTIGNLVYKSVVAEGYAKVTGLASQNVTEIRIPETVTLKISRKIVDADNKITYDYVSMKLEVRAIENSAFSGKKSLVSVKFNNNLVNIGSNAFDGCIGLAGTLKIPASVTSIGDFAFSGSGIRELGFEDGSKLVELGNSAFSNCENLVSAKIPDRLAEIPKNAFARSGLTGISILSPSTTKIGKTAFWKCVNLKTILLHKNIQEIDTMAFASCGNAANPINLTFPENVTDMTIRCEAFQFANIEVLTFNTGTFKIEDSAFSRNNSLQQLRFPTEEMNITLGKSAFFQCRNLKDFKMPEGLTRIEDDCFGECESLRDILLPKSVSYLGAWSFGNIKELNSAKRSWCPECNSNVVLDNHGAFQNSGISICLTCVNYDEKEKKHKKMSTLNAAHSRATGRGGVIFGEDACRGCGNLVHLPPDIISIGKNAFYECRNLSWIPMTENYVIPDYAYYDSGIGSVDIKPTVYEIGAYAFANTPNLHEITLPDSLKTIKEGAFYYNDFRMVDLPAKVGNIGSKAFFHAMDEKVLESNYEEFLGFIEDMKDSMDEDEFKDLYDDLIKDWYFGIEEIISRNPVPPVVDGEDVFTPFIYKNAVLHVPADAVEAYKSAPVWCLFEKIYPIGSSGIDGIHDDKGVISIENGILSIGNVASDCPVEVYTVSGMLIKSLKGGGVISGLARGLYVVRIGADVRKIWL